jgi:hypothetical protein
VRSKNATCGLTMPTRSAAASTARSRTRARPRRVGLAPLREQRGVRVDADAQVTVGRERLERRRTGSRAPSCMRRRARPLAHAVLLQARHLEARRAPRRARRPRPRARRSS